MRCVTYRTGQGSQVGIVVGVDVVDAAAAADLADLPHPSSPLELATASASVRESVQAAARELVFRGRTAGTVSELRFDPPVSSPEKIICLGLNYPEHAVEAGMEIPPAPVLFPKFRNSLAGHRQPIAGPSQTNELDYEGELVVVIGQRSRNLDISEALGAVAGYMPGNDVSARDLQLVTSQWLPGKALDGFAPCGPALVTADEVSDPQDLRITTRVNDEVVQDASTAEMIFPIAETIAYLSSLMTLAPGDLIFTGTPPGVGAKQSPPRFLTPGDQVSVSIEGLGELTTPIVALEDLMPIPTGLQAA